MPRRLLRDGRIVVDDWQYLGETGAPESPAALIIPFDRWVGGKETFCRKAGRLGVQIGPAQQVEQLVGDLAALSLIAADFPSPGEGRGYSQARLLRERWKFTGELRATGHVRRDQLFFMARCGFDSFELPDAELPGAEAALHTFTAAYQPANDAGLTERLKHR